MVQVWDLGPRYVDAVVRVSIGCAQDVQYVCVNGELRAREVIVPWAMVVHVACYVPQGSGHVSVLGHARSHQYTQYHLLNFVFAVNGAKMVTLVEEVCDLCLVVVVAVCQIIVYRNDQYSYERR